MVVLCRSKSGERAVTWSKSGGDPGLFYIGATRGGGGERVRTDQHGAI